MNEISEETWRIETLGFWSIFAGTSISWPVDPFPKAVIDFTRSAAYKQL